MRKSTTALKHNLLKLSGNIAVTLTALAVLAATLSATKSYAGSATWNLTPTSGDWNTGANWMPHTVPNGPSDIASFATSNLTQVGLSARTEISGLNFSSGANAFTISAEPGVPLILSGSGITNASNNVQTFLSEVNGGFVGGFIFVNSATSGEGTIFGGDGIYISFSDSATADHAIITLALGPESQPGQLVFFDDSSAGEATVETDFGGEVIFDGNSTAANASFTTVGGFVIYSINSTAANSVVTCSEGGGTSFDSFATAGNGYFISDGATDSSQAGTFVDFIGNSTAGDATFILNGGTAQDAPGAKMNFIESTTAGNASITMNGGTGGGEGGALFFFDRSAGGTASIGVFDNGQMDISNHARPGVTIGSLEGNGQVFLGARALAVGNNNGSTTFSGTIQDGGSGGGTGGSLTKVGTGTLTLAGANTYTGTTTVSAGVLEVSNRSGSGTGTGAVKVNAGTLGGKGRLAGAVTIGTGSGAGAFLAPSVGANTLAKLTIQNALTFKADGTYTYKLNTKRARADQVIANGVTIENGAQFSFTPVANKRLTAGTVFTAISNTSANPIAGTFANLPDGSTFTAGRNSYQVSYSGGDGNDLTLTVVL